MGVHSFQRIHGICHLELTVAAAPLSTATRAAVPDASQKGKISYLPGDLSFQFFSREINRVDSFRQLCLLVIYRVEKGHDHNSVKSA